MICPGEPHQRNPNAPKFEDRSQETEWQERCAREAAWKLAKSVLKLKEKNKAAFFSLSENRCLLALSNLRTWGTEFVDDSGASMHMISKKDLNDAEMDTLTKSCSPTIVITANGEVQTHEEATVYVKELDICLTMKVFEDCASSLMARKALRWTRILKRMDQRSRTTSHLKRYSDTVQHGALRSDRGSWFVIEFFLQFSLFNIHDTFKEGNWSSYVFLKLVYFTNHNCVKRQWDWSTGRPEWDRFPSSIGVKFTFWTERTERPVDQANQKSKTN